MDTATIKEAREYATEHGLEVRGTRETMGNTLALYVYDPLRNGYYTFSTFESMKMHLAENTETVRRRTRARAFVHGRRRAGSVS